MVFIANYWTASSARSVTVFSNFDSVALYLNNSLTAGTVTISASATGLSSGTATVTSVVESAQTVITYGMSKESKSLPEIIPISPKGTTILVGLASAKGHADGRLFLYNCMGENIASWNVSGRNAMVSLENYPQGVYMAKLDNEGARYTRKVVRY